MDKEWMGYSPWSTPFQGFDQGERGGYLASLTARPALPSLYATTIAFDFASLSTRMISNVCRSKSCLFSAAILADELALDPLEFSIPLTPNVQGRRISNLRPTLRRYQPALIFLCRYVRANPIA